MKIAFTAKGAGWDSAMDPRFGRTEFILLYNEETVVLSSVDNRSIADDAHGAGPQTAQILFDLNPDVLITGNGPGRNAAAVLKKTGVKIFTGAGDMLVRDAFETYKSGSLTEL